MSRLALSTECIHRGRIAVPVKSPVVSPIYPASSYFYLDEPDNIYPRYFNLPNQEVLERKLAVLEKGEAAIVFSSGMAAISTTLLTMLNKGDHAIFQVGLYGGTTKFVTSLFEKFGVEYTITDGISADDFKKAVQSNTKLIYVESPSNPLLGVIDFSAIVKLAKSKKILTMIDNTFASPINQNPIEFGFDIVAHSATKYLGGHSDICAGAVISRQSLIDKIRAMARNFGGSLNAITCAQLERSLKTLAVRVEQQNENAMRLAEYLQSHPKIENIYYPGLQTHPGHEVAKLQMRGFGGMVSFELSDELDTKLFQQKLNVILPALSLGGVESTICSPVLTSHVELTPAKRQEAGIKDNLLRLSVGIEDADDLIADIEQAFRHSKAVQPETKAPERMLVEVRY